MNAKQARIARKGYKEAGHIYWTKDMEKAIRAIHKSKNFWKGFALVEIPVLAYFVIEFFW